MISIRSHHGSGMVELQLVFIREKFSNVSYNRTMQSYRIHFIHFCLDLVNDLGFFFETGIHCVAFADLELIK